MSDKPTEVAPVAEPPVDPSPADAPADNDGSDDSDDDEPETTTTDATGVKKKKKNKKKSKKKKNPAATATPEPLDIEQAKAALENLPEEQISQLLKLNPALLDEIASGSANGIKLAQMLKTLTLQDIMTGLATSGRNVKDMGSYKFWATQPVPRLDEKVVAVEEGPLKIQTIDEVPKEPMALLPTFEWCEVDFMDKKELAEVHTLLQGHYVEDTESTLRFNYSLGMLKWGTMSPGWKKMWHVGIRAKESQKLVAFISAIPVKVNVHGKEFVTSEVNFLVVHKKLRGHRIAPALIKEITRRSNLQGIWQGLYTGGSVLPRPVSTCRYYHRALNWTKLYEVGFSPLPRGKTPSQMVANFKLPDQTKTPGLRPMKATDIDAVLGLVRKYMQRYEFVPVWTKEEFVHWFPTETPEGEEQFFWCYVVEDEKKQITDFFSFYCLESSIIENPKHKNICAAYLSYYATNTLFNDNNVVKALAADQRKIWNSLQGVKSKVEKEFSEKSAGELPSEDEVKFARSKQILDDTVKTLQDLRKKALKARLNLLMDDALILAKKYKFDVMNALSLMDNGLFLEEKKYGPGDGQLHYYLFNYRANPISGGVDKNNQLDKEGLSGIGIIML